MLELTFSMVTISKIECLEGLKVRLSILIRTHNMRE